MGNVTKLLLLGAAVLVTVLVIGIGVTLFGQGQSLTNAAGKDMEGLNQALYSKKFEVYDNTERSGSDVINTIHQYADNGQIPVSVKTKEATVEKVYSSKTSVYYSVSDPSSSEYINPAGVFTSTIKKNSNGVVTQIGFVQK